MTQKRFKKLLRAAQIPEHCIQIFVDTVKNAGGQISYEFALKRPNKAPAGMFHTKLFGKSYDTCIRRRKNESEG